MTTVTECFAPIPEVLQTSILRGIGFIEAAALAQPNHRLARRSRHS
jgi:hypothetical protein